MYVCGGCLACWSREGGERSKSVIPKVERSHHRLGIHVSIGIVRMSVSQSSLGDWALNLAGLGWAGLGLA